MNHRLNRYILIQNRKGSALIFVILIFMVISIMVISIIAINQNNLRQTRHQESMIEAYYLSYSGIEIGYAALVANEDEWLNKFINKEINNLEEIGLKFGEGEIDIVISSDETLEDEMWIKITSTGRLKDSNISYSMSMSFLADNKFFRKWER